KRTATTTATAPTTTAATGLAPQPVTTSEKSQKAAPSQNRRDRGWYDASAWAPAFGLRPRARLRPRLCTKLVTRREDQSARSERLYNLLVVGRPLHFSRWVEAVPASTGRLTWKNPLADRGRAIHKRQARLRVHVLTRLIPPRSALELPVSHHLKIHSADQLGPVSLGGFHVGHSLFQSAHDRPSDNSRNRPNQDRRIQSDRSNDCCQYHDSSCGHCDF